MTDQFKLTFEIPEFSSKIEYGKEILFLGSCFSDEIALKVKHQGFKVDSNPFGTIFHPLALSRFIKETLSERVISERPVQQNDIFFSWDASSSVFGFSVNEVIGKAQKARLKWKRSLSTASHLFVTLGSSWGYHLTENNLLVANCHKFPGTNFRKELSLQANIVSEWKETISLLLEHNPSLKIIFTVSPVRHIKDGLIENNRSKAVLLDSVRILEKEMNCSYFPSFEIVMDELRDYRFFKADHVHPNELAINYIWQRFSNCYFSNETMEIVKEVLKIRNEEAHKSITPTSEASVIQLKKLKEKREQLLIQFPTVQLD
ncbi:MAG: hypothetical protein RI883_966 [Bacteroidota bacterium]|jgi:hypothetical protein